MAGEIPQFKTDPAKSGGAQPAEAERTAELQGQAATTQALKTGVGNAAGAPLYTPQGAEKLAGTVPQTPSISQDIDHLLSKYMNELTNLGPEYGQEMEFLKPYLNPGDETLGQVISQSKANASPAGDTTVNAADAKLAQAADNLSLPGFGALAAANKSYENVLPYQDAMQAALGYQKYLETYGGQQVNTSAWPQSIQDAYQAITNTAPGAAPSGLPGLSSAAAGANATNTAAAIATQLANPGSTSGGGNG